MAASELLRRVPEAPQSLLDILDAKRGPLEPPIRSEIFGAERFAQHGRSLGETHRATVSWRRWATFFPRLRDNIRVLREAHQFISQQASTGYEVSPAAEWLLDNFHLIEAQLKEVHEGLPRSYFRDLPVLQDPPLAGLPRVYGVAWAFVAHTDGAFNEELLTPFLRAYQETRALTLGELWALPTTLRVVLIENLRRLAERVATNKAARELANLCCDRIDTFTIESLDELLDLLNRRGVGRMFLRQMAQRLHEHRSSTDPRYLDWLDRVLPDLAEAQNQLPIDQAADNLSVSNAITSLRSIGDADWVGLIGEASALMRLMMAAPTFVAERDDTRDETLHAIERLARRCRRGELEVAQTLLDLMRGSAASGALPDDAADEVGATTVPSYWLRGPGRTRLLRAIGVQPRTSVDWRALGQRSVLPGYLLALALATSFLVGWILVVHSNALPSDGAPLWTSLVAGLLMLFPASEAVVAVINRLISESARPTRLPRLALADGIAADQRVMVVIPAMLTDLHSGRELAHRLELHYLANPQRHAQFALLTDYADAAAERQPQDEAVLAAGRAEIEALNLRYPARSGDPTRFLLLHRPRRFSTSEQRWIGWERKRGKLEQLIDALAEGRSDAFLDLGELSRMAPGTVYVVTLDSDTRLPPGRLAELVGVAAHPHNQPRLDPTGRRVVAGYGILQPRVVTPLPAPERVTRYHWLFAGQCGIDPYSAATSEVYQDVFREGSFTGKGLLDVKAVHAVLSGRLPEEQVLSHDLLEGSIARCAAVTDVMVIEDAPFHADVAASRVHRWTRGDWQLLPLLANARRYGLAAINRWKMIDNLRRSLVAPMSLGVLVVALASGVVSPWAALVLVFAANCAGPLLGAVAGLAPSRDELALRHFYRAGFADMLRAICAGLWGVAQVLQQGMANLDAIARALYRTLVSRRHLLQWTTAASAEAAASTEFAQVLRQHWQVPAAALAIAVALLAAGTPYPVPSLLLCALWALSPALTWWVSRPVRPQGAVLAARDRSYLEGVARDTWRFFERSVGPDDNHLPPDNLQITPHPMLARRTSPTNIGLYLLSTACAREFGWIGTQEMLGRVEATLGTLEGMQRYRGHFLTWYDTETAQPLLPHYVSTVDSGNLSGHLLALAQACLERAEASDGDAALRRALANSAGRLGALLPALHQLSADHSKTDALVRLMSMQDPLAMCRDHAPEFELLIRDAEEELAAELPSQDTAPSARTPHDMLAWRLGDHLATLRSAQRDCACTEDAARTAERLRDVARRCQKMAWQAQFGFLYHRKRHLFHIGFRVQEQQLDASFYDLLASESRLASLLAIARGDVPTGHWAALGRPFYAVGSHAALRSWSGSMFEYLMPTLVIDEPRGSVLRDACEAAVLEQIAFGAGHSVPWGISESAYAGSDHTLAYQYAPQGVPRLALRRTPADELVIAPYAVVLATQVAPQAAVDNLRRLDRLAARGRYGFIEALDYTPSRQSGADPFTRVDTFMAHHQGMTVVSIANLLLGSNARRWGMADPHVEAVASLLHERVPRELSVLHEPPLAPAPSANQRRPGGLARELVPGEAAVMPTHLLSNGRYSVSLRPNGAGWSRFGRTGLTRWRDDALRDAHGSFFHLRWESQPRPMSLTQHPAPDPNADYRCDFHADRVCFHARWPEVAARTTVWVSPEDDIEFRQVELRNHGTTPLDLELMSSFEVTLADDRADEAHPAFSNLFVRARWVPAVHPGALPTLVFERKPRLHGEPGMHMAHFLVDADPQQVSVSAQTDRLRWLGRNRESSHPQAALGAPAPLDPAEHDLDTGLDPVCVLAARTRLAPGAKIRLTFCTAASDNAATLHAVIDKYRQVSHVERASMMSATLAGIRRRELRLSPENADAVQTLTTALALCLTRTPFRSAGSRSDVSRSEVSDTPVCDRRLLWRHGISGDKPIVLVSGGVPQGLGLLRTLAQALRTWAWGGLACDLVVVNAEAASYLMPLQREIGALRDRFLTESNNRPGGSVVGFFLLRADEVGADELSTLRILARVRLNADGRPLSHHMQEWREAHENAFTARAAVAGEAVATVPGLGAAPRVTQGDFSSASGEFRFDVSAFQRPQRPWVNVLANPDFGAQISEAGGGYSWALNSRLNQLTTWSNDPVGDTPGEWFLIEDLRSRQVWSVAPSAWADPSATYRVAHGQGYSVIGHRRGDLEVTTTWCVDPNTSVKQIRVRIVNRGLRTQRLRVVGIAEWVMGGNRTDRLSVETAGHSTRLVSPPAERERRSVVRERRLTTVLCTQRERSAGFGDGTAFLALATDVEGGDDWTCDRRECFDPRGRLVLPEQFARRGGFGLDPCAAVASRLDIAAGASIERVFLLGFGATPDAARQLALAAAQVPAAQRLEAVRGHWDRLLGATRVRTPDPLFDALVNRWLLYQTVACRMWAKAGFYQAGGAYGYRDQLQDAMALAWAEPDLLRRQIVLGASRQFAAGDVQHWWHAPTGAGVRTHFSDDLLWLPFASAHYVQVSGDASVLDEAVPFLEGMEIPDGAEDAYYVPEIGQHTASVYEHGARTIDRSLRVGIHGLPLMGTGDWNDGMNRVGHEGRGESVWLAWFLCDVIAAYAPIAERRGDTERAQRWRDAALALKDALNREAWDGQWYKRAFFDNGEPLGSSERDECRIDLIAQAWAVLSNVAPPANQRMALAAIEQHLADPATGLVRLLDPPLQDAEPSAGYIQAYPRGVRENGGQYSHAGVWALMAQARAGRADIAWRYFTWLSPAHRSRHPTHGPAYAIEPYVMAGDIYSAAPYAGRGGWSWYTGSAGWLHRAAIESMFGLQVRGNLVSFSPCLPPHWPSCEMTLSRGGRSVRFEFVRASATPADTRGAEGPAPLRLAPGQAVEWSRLADGGTCIVELPLPTSFATDRNLLAAPV
jgi:cyclic beta-1,2-glucan synthetase